ncbi:MAG TPA: guanylate kinase [Planctomycetaceae bacterium]|nr:guanylate kinase [Planctomycetaceae bacterium]
MGDPIDQTEKRVPTRVLVISGPSGSGKTTLVGRLMSVSPVKLRKAVSATTRPRRAGEIDGEHYHFLSVADFRQRMERGEFLETAEVFGSGNLYGTLKSELDAAVREEAWAFLEIDVEGALRVMEEYPDAVTIFIRTSSDDEYEKRLRGRGTETEEVIQKRLATARRELSLADKYQYQVVNDDLDRAVGEIVSILNTEEGERNARRV